MGHLVAISGPSAGKRYELEKECVLGRSFNSDIYIGDLNVSRRHARIMNAEGSHILEDLGSGNGTFVNDRQITRHTLNGRDVIRIGGSSFRYEQEVKKPRWGAEVQTVIADLMHHAPGADPLTQTLTQTLTLDPLAAAARKQAEAKAAAAAAGSAGTGLGPAMTGPILKTDSAPELTGLPEGRATKMLEAMYAVADAIGSELHLDKLLEKVLTHLFEVFPQAERGFVLMINDKSGQLVPEAVMQRPGSAPSSGGLSFSQTMVDQVMEQGAVIRGTPSGTRPARPRGPAEPPAATPKIGAPLICRNEAFGTLHLEGRSGAAAFSQDDLALLSAIARQAGVAIANARTGQQLLTQQRLEADLQLARKIQQSFLPQHLPQVAGLRFETHYLPALHVGGDFYDIIEIWPGDDGQRRGKPRIGILVGDISGKGVSAALLMAKVTSDIRLFSRSLSSPGKILSAANRTLMESGQDAMFATVLYIMLDLEARTFTVANAGHQPPMVCSSRFAGISELDDATAVALGVVPEMEYPQEVYELVAGDVVLLYTDGINEAMNRHAQEYNMQRLRNAVVSGPAEPSQVVQRVVADVRRFVGNAQQSDDQTLVAFGVTAE
ncbi:MAG: SpoIIE family protein phosphatase [Myxococcales bacterium]|nr:SpoIIE family protein phosphatase [Myxococcales bacterium]